MWEFYGIMTATNQAGLSTQLSMDHDDLNRNSAQRDSEHPMGQNISQLLKIHDEYMTRFKFICEEMENKFFKQNKNGHSNQYILGDKPTCIDHVYYQELLSAMILSGQGTQTEFFSADTATRLYKLKNMTKWYRLMSQDKSSKSISDRFMKEMKSSGSIHQT